MEHRKIQAKLEQNYCVPWKDANVYNLLEINDTKKGIKMQKYSVDFVIDAADLENEAAGYALDQLTGLGIGVSNDVPFAGSFIEAKNGVEAAKKFLRNYKKCFGHYPVMWFSEIVSYTNISQRTDYTPEAIRLFATGQRGQGNFPKPIGHIGQGNLRTPIWYWSDVHNWLIANEKIEGDDIYPNQVEIMAINSIIATSETFKKSLASQS